MRGVMEEIKLKFILDSLIRSKGISARQLSKDTGIAQSTLSNYLQGKSVQKSEHLVKLADYFSTSIDYLLIGKERKAPSLEEALTEHLYSGYLKVKIEKVIPTKRIGESKD